MEATGTYVVPRSTVVVDDPVIVAGLPEKGDPYPDVPVMVATGERFFFADPSAPDVYRVAVVFRERPR